jgi:hypothetical protein
MSFALRVYDKWPKASEMPQLLASIRAKVPEKYLLEMKGLVEGFNNWAKENKISTQLTEDDILLVNLIPDKFHFTPKKDEVISANDLGALSRMQNVACTVVIDRDKEEGISMGRNMDWPSLGVMGTNSILIKRLYGDYSTAEIGLPGIVGTVTGMNSHGLSLAMNVCDGSSEEGIPAVFHNRLCLECKSIEEVSKVVEKNPPMGSYHLTVADQKDAQSFHLYQHKEDKKHYVRRFEDQKPLIVTNFKYYWSLSEDCQEQDCGYSTKRKEIIQDFWKDAEEKIDPAEVKKRELVTHALSLPYVNNFLSTHKVLMQPSLGRMGVAFDDSFAGGRPLHWLTREELFQPLSTK